MFVQLQLAHIFTSKGNDWASAGATKGARAAKQSCVNVSRDTAKRSGTRRAPYHHRSQSSAHSRKGKHAVRS